MILDLKTFVDETLDIRMADGKVLHVPKPSQKMVLKILGLQNISINTPEDEVNKALNTLTVDILNSNIDGITFTYESVAALNEKTKVMIVTTYTEFMQKLQANPTSPCRNRSEKRKEKAGIRNFFRAFRK